MKKLLSVALVLCMLLSIVPMAYAADDGTLNLALTSDLHISLPTAPPAGEGMFSYASGTGNMTREGNAILDAFLDSVEANSPEYVLIAGDIVDSGKRENYIYAAQLLSDFEDRTGIQVFVINGNHDTSYYGKNAYADFKEIFARFGYDEAIAVDADSCSYAVNLSDSYRLLAIDSCEFLTGGDGLDDARFAWIEQQVNKAKQDNVKLIAMQHHNIVEHFGLQSTVAKDYIVKNYKTVAAKYADWGIKYVFTGHVHMHDIASFKSDSGNEVYDILTTSLNSYPLKYRTAAFTDDIVSFATNSLTGIDTSLLAAGYSNEQLSLLSSDVNAYAKGYFEYAIKKLVLGYVNAQAFRRLAGNYFGSDSSVFEVTDVALPKIYEALTMPLYSVGGEASLSSIAAKYDITIPKSSFNTLLDSVVFVIEALSCGDEYYPVYSNEIQTLLKGVSAGLNYALENIDTKTSAKAIYDVLTYFNFDMPDLFASMGSDMLTNKALVDILVSKALLPVVEQITIDKSPVDNDTRLPGYGSTGITAESFFQKFIAFLRRVYAGVMDIFYLIFG